MAIVINGSGTVTGISVGGLPDDIVDAGTLASDALDSAVTINDTGADVDFRVESSNNANAFFIDGADGNVTIQEELILGSSSNGRIEHDSNSDLIIYNKSDNKDIIFKCEKSTNDVIEAMRIDSSGSGAVLFGKTAYALLGTAGIECRTGGRFDVTNDGGASINTNRLSSDGDTITFHRQSADVGSINVTTSSTAYTTSSDYRLKENVDYDFDATTRLKQLKPARFNFIIDDTITVDGFLAHEVSSIVPEAISGTKDAMTTEVLYVEGDELPEGKSIGDVKEASVIDPQGIDQSKLVPLLVKTIQELEARITALEA